MYTNVYTSFIHFLSSQYTNHWCFHQGAHHQNGADRVPSRNRDRGAWPPGTWKNRFWYLKQGGLHHQIYKISLSLLWISSRSHSVDEVEFLPPVDVPPLKGVLHVPTGAGFLSWTVFHRPGFLWNKGHFPHFKTISEWVVVCFVATSHPDLCGDSWECFGPLEIQTM